MQITKKNRVKDTLMINAFSFFVGVGFEISKLIFPHFQNTGTNIDFAGLVHNTVIIR